MLSLARGPARCTVHGACPTVAQEAGLSPEAAVLSPLGEGARALWPTDNADMSKAHAHGSLALDSHELGSRLSSANSDWLEGGPRMRTPATPQCVHSCSALLRGVWMRIAIAILRRYTASSSVPQWPSLRWLDLSSPRQPQVERVATRAPDDAAMCRRLREREALSHCLGCAYASLRFWRFEAIVWSALSCAIYRCIRGWHGRPRLRGT